MHYANPRETRCSSALKGRLVVQGKDIGSLGTKHGLMQGARFSTISYDSEISLFDEHPGNIIQRSFVIQHGEREADHVCATVYRTKYAQVLPGTVPCVLDHYPDCLVAVSPGKCTRKACSGYRQHWGITKDNMAAINNNTLFCTLRYEVYPTTTSNDKLADGTLPCSLGRHGNLYPAER